MVRCYFIQEPYNMVSRAQMSYFMFNAILFMFSSPVQINIILTMLHHKLIQLLDAFQLNQHHTQDKTRC